MLSVISKLHIYYNSPLYISMKVLDFHGIQVKSINIEGDAFLARDMPTHARDMPTHQNVHTSG